jgi:hypothetical protein
VNSWIGVDLDGTLAVYDGWRGIHHIGEPITVIKHYVKALIGCGVDVRIVTARCQEGQEAIYVIEEWTERHLGKRLQVTDRKDMGMVLLIDDRAVNPWTDDLPPVRDLVKKIGGHWTDPMAPPMELSRAIPQGDGDSGS